MNKKILLAACLFTGIHLHGQVNETGFVLRLTGNYSETATNNALQYVNGYKAKNKNGNISVSAGYMHRHWLYGLGFEYNHDKTMAVGSLYTRQSDSEASVFMEQGEVKLNGYGGIGYASYYLPIYRNLYFTPSFYLGLGNKKGDYSGIVASASSLPTDQILYWSSGPSPYASGYEDKISMDYFYMQISPELTWFFSNRWGINLQLGGLKFDMSDFDWSNSIKQINFNPTFWKLGILFKL